MDRYGFHVSIIYRKLISRRSHSEETRRPATNPGCAGAASPPDGASTAELESNRRRVDDCGGRRTGPPSRYSSLEGPLHFFNKTPSLCDLNGNPPVTSRITSPPFTPAEHLLT